MTTGVSLWVSITTVLKDEVVMTWVNDSGKISSGKSVLLLSDNSIASGNRYLMASLIAKSIPANMVIYSFDHDNNTELLLKAIKELKVKIVGLSLFSTRRLEFKNICKRIKKEFPNIAIVCGGPDVNTNYLNVIDWADYVCLFDGELAFPALCNELFQDKKDVKISNIFYKSGDEIVCNSLQNETNLDKYKFPWFSDENIFEITSGSIIPHKDSLSKTYNVYASRGCPYKCTYCANHVFNNNFGGKYYRYRSVGNVIDEIQSTLSRTPQIETIIFHDEQFGVNKKWFGEFIDRYEDIKIPFFFQMNPNTITKEKFERLKNIGLQSTSFGMQSASKRIRKIYARPESLSKIKEANQMLYDLKIPHFFDVIVDNPYETQEDIEATFNFLLSLRKPFVAKTFDLVYLPETVLTKKLLEENKITPEQIEGNFVYKDGVEWRVREKALSLDLDKKYLIALIQMTGNVLLPNLLLRILYDLRRFLPKIIKKLITKIVLTKWYYQNQSRLWFAVSLARNKGVGALFGKLARKLAKRFRVISS